MLFGRGEECGLLDLLLEQAAAGESSTLLVRGEVGIGKSALLRYARERAAVLGFKSVEGHGLENEAELPYAGLSEILRPILDLLDRLPAPQGLAVAAALAIAPGGEADRHAVGAGTLTLLAAAAEERPLLILVDDVHWVDIASANALVFAARRLRAEGIVVMVALRDDEASPFASAAFPELQLKGLQRDAAAELLAERGRTLSQPVVDALTSATSGNPLALIEVPELLDDAQLAGLSPLDEPLPPGPGIAEAFERRLAKLPLPTRKALVVAAASATGLIQSIAGALPAVGVELWALDRAESADVVVTARGRIQWRHPLLRSSVYYGASAAARRVAHAALAETEPPDVAVWHRAAATVGPNDDVAAALERSALDARRRGAVGTAARAFERAAELSTSTRDRTRRLLEGGRDYALVSDFGRAHVLLDGALDGASDPRVRADVQLGRASLLVLSGAPREGQTLLTREAANVEADHPSLAARMLAEAGVVATMGGVVRPVLEICQRANAVAKRAGPGARVLAEAQLANALVLAGRADDARPLLERSLRELPKDAPLELFASLVYLQGAGHTALWLEENDAAREVYERAVTAARAASAPALLPFPLSGLCELEYRTGRWTAAHALGAEAVQLARDTGELTVLPYAQIVLAQVEAGRGREAECRRLVDDALSLVEPLGVNSLLIYSGAVLGFLDHSLGLWEQARGHLEALAARVEEYELAEPAVVQWRPDLIETYVQLKLASRAEDALHILQAEADRTGRVWAHATAARCRGLLAADAEFELHFETALAWHSQLASPFERARTQLRLGERRRRARRRADARGVLTEALATFDRLGAVPWAERAQVELRAAGGVVARHRPAEGELTPQELQVALAVAEGATNREAAAALFLSPKTIEFHLGNVYRKLGVRSRSELAAMLGTGKGIDDAKSRAPL